MTRLMPLACAAAFLLPSTVAAQYTQYPLSSPQYPVLELSVGFTAMSRGPGEGSERAMHAMGFHSSGQMTQTLLDGFWKVEVGVRPHRTLGIMTTRVRNGTYATRREHGDSLHSRHVVITRAVTWSYRPNGWLSIGAGPAIHKRRFSIQSPRAPVGVRSDWGLGAVAGANVKFKRDNGAFLHAMVQHRYAGSLVSESVPVALARSRGTPDDHVQWPSTRIPFSHRMIGIGFGVEF
jgi:hypothetical protein